MIDIINNFTKIFFINIFVYLFYIKISKHNNFKIDYKLIFIDIIMAIMYVILMPYINPIFLTPYIIAIIIKIVIKQNFNYCLLLANIAFVFTYIIYLIAVLISGALMIAFAPTVKYNDSISIITIFGVMLLIYWSLNKIKRFKNGLNFLQDADSLTLISLIVNIISLTITVIFGLLHNSENYMLNYIIAWCTISTFAGFIYWLQSQITKHYKKNMRDRTISVQKAEIDEQTKLLEKVEAENLKLATAVHKYNHKLSSLELAMKSAISHNLNTEFAEELSVMLKDTEDLSNSFAKECDVAKCILPLTNVPSIDNMFKYMQDEASKCNINFDLKINESINELIDNIISKDLFETLLGDHLRDAIIAVNASDNSYKSILTTLGLVDGCYELSIYDTGIEFQIDTLLKLGKEQVTTHKDSGGSGIGFMTTFETLKTTKASLVIEEYSPETTNYTKSVSIRFDGKNQYRIYSYRADDIKKQNKEKRIIVKNIE